MELNDQFDAPVAFSLWEKQQWTHGWETTENREILSLQGIKYQSVITKRVARNCMTCHSSFQVSCN